MEVVDTVLRGEGWSLNRAAGEQWFFVAGVRQYQVSVCLPKEVVELLVLGLGMKSAMAPKVAGKISVPCKACAGSGDLWADDPTTPRGRRMIGSCPHCNGSGDEP